MPVPTVETGDVVLFLDEKVRGKWPLARVIGTHRTARDGVIRHVELKFQNKVLKRSARQVLPLEYLRT